MISPIYDLLIFIAGFIDSIAGGGGLISLPVFTILVGPGPEAIGTNKIIAVTAALTAFVQYARHGHFRFQIALPFFITICIGAVMGSQCAYLIPVDYFRIFIILACPPLLYLILNKKYFLTNKAGISPSYKKLALVGFLCGFYDGVFGPGGGTLMLICLISWTHLPLMVALACSKFANVLSATGGLTSYALGGSVHWNLGIKMMALSFIGAALGSHLANKKMEKIVRPMLVFVVAGLLIKLFLDQFSVSF